MPAYIIFTREGPVKNQSEMDIYQRMNRENRPQVAAMPTPLVIYGNMENLEGKKPDGVIVLQFPTLEDAKAWYDSPEYQAALVHRQNAADYSAYIVQGI